MSCDWLKQSKGMLAGLDGAVFDDLDDACDPTYNYDGVIVGDDYFDELRGYYEDIEGELDEGRQKQSPKLGASVSELRTWAEHATDMALLGLKYAFFANEVAQRANEISEVYMDRLSKKYRPGFTTVGEELVQQYRFWRVTANYKSTTTHTHRAASLLILHILHSSQK